MWGKFWFRTARQRHAASARDLGVRNAGWAAPIPEPAARTDKAPLTGDQAAEVAEFLARVYTHQRC